MGSAAICEPLVGGVLSPQSAIALTWLALDGRSNVAEGHVAMGAMHMLHMKEHPSSYTHHMRMHSMLNCDSGNLGAGCIPGWKQTVSIRVTRLWHDIDSLQCQLRTVIQALQAVSFTGPRRLRTTAANRACTCQQLATSAAAPTAPPAACGRRKGALLGAPGC